MIINLTEKNVHRVIKDRQPMKRYQYILKKSVTKFEVKFCCVYKIFSELTTVKNNSRTIRSANQLKKPKLNQQDLENETK